jgi:hypothetical protein
MILENSRIMTLTTVKMTKNTLPNQRPTNILRKNKTDFITKNKLFKPTTYSK